jgi:hypothetical protein
MQLPVAVVAAFASPAALALLLLLVPEAVAQTSAVGCDPSQHLLHAPAKQHGVDGKQSGITVMCLWKNSLQELV